MNYQTMYDTASNVQNRQRVASALLKQAIAVTGEAPATTNHTNRAALAKAVANNPDNYAAVFTLGIVVQQNPAAAPTDAQLDTAIQALWDVFAGVV